MSQMILIEKATPSLLYAISTLFSCVGLYLAWADESAMNLRSGQRQDAGSYSGCRFQVMLTL
jgi:hypothetical protein